MKRWKNIVLAAVLAVGVITPTAGCDEDCEHSVSTWKTVTAETCMAVGLEQGVCGKCYETVSREIPINPNAHVYGAWQVQKPTQDASGLATRVCAANNAHVEKETLPALSDLSAYSEKITARPSVLGVGERTYTYKKNKDITFTEEIPNTGIQTVKDAVDLGAAEESRALIRKAEGTMTTKFFNENNQNLNDTTQEHWYEFGDDYVHIYDGTDVDEGRATDRYYFLQDGEIYGLRKQANEDKYKNDLADSAGVENYINGSRFYLQYNNNLGFFYGVEDLLAGVYRAARWSTNGDFKEERVTNDAGETEYTFSFGHTENSGDDSGYFSVTSVRFTLTEAYTIDTLHVQSIVYVNNSAQNDGSVIKTWAYDENGHAYLLPGANQGARYVSYIDMAQTLKSSDDVVPVNPHTFDKMYVQDFDIAYNGEPVTNSVTFAADVSTGLNFSIINIQPMSALEDYSFDKFSFYLRTKDEKGKTVDKPIDFDTMNTVNMTVYIQEDTVVSEEGKKSTKTSFSLKSKLAGEQQLVIKTVTGLEKVLVCNVSEKAPSALYPVVFQYDRGEYTRNSARGAGNKTISATVYANQPLYFTADVPKDEENYVAPNYTATVSPAPSGEETRLIETVVNKEAVTRFSTDKTGSYTITLTSVLGGQSCTVKVTVVASPTLASLMEYAYTETLDEPYYGKVTVTFENLTEIREGESLTGYTFTANVVVENFGTERVKCTYNVEEGTVESEHLDGINANFKLGINEGYDFLLSYYLEDFSVWETVILEKVVNE